MRIKNVEFVRCTEIGNYMNQCQLKTLENSEYKYLWLGSYGEDFSKKDFSGWSDDAFKIRFKEQDIGFIKWYFNRDDDLIESIIIYIEPEFLNSGFGPVALILFLDYIFIERGFRKVSFTVCIKNERALKIYSRCPSSELVGIHKKHVRLRDGTFADLAKFDIMKDNYILQRKNVRINK